MNKLIVLVLALVALCFMGYSSYSFIVDLQVENAMLSSSLQKQNEAIKALSLQKEAIEAYNAKSLSMQEEFLKSYEGAKVNADVLSKAPPDTDYKDSYITLKEIENALTIFYASSP